MNGRPNRVDTDRADLVAHVAERIRTHPDPLLRARAVQIICVKEGMQAIDRWMDPRGAVIADNELRRRVDELAASRSWLTSNRSSASADSTPLDVAAISPFMASSDCRVRRHTSSAPSPSSCRRPCTGSAS